MKRKRRTAGKARQKSISSTKSSFQPKRWMVALLALSLVFNIFFIWQKVSPPNSMELLTDAAYKATYTVTTPVVLRDTKDPSYRIRVGELWEHKMQRMGGYVALFPVSNFPDVAVIVDPQVRIVSMNLVAELRLGGSRVDMNPYFSKFYGLGLEALAGNTGIFKPNDPVLSRFSDQFRDGLLKTLQALFIRVNGRAEFERTFPQGIHFASTGNRLRVFDAVDVEGKTMGLRDLQDQQTVFIYVDNNCPLCEVKCSIIRDLAEDHGVRVIFICTGDDQKTQNFVEKYARGERVIQDTDRSVARSLFLSDPPSIMLIDRDLTIVYKGYVDDVSEDAEPYFKLFGR